MKVFKTATAFTQVISELKIQGKKIGFVPTMGALHKGHLTLVESAMKSCDIVVCSIYVNPLQFNNPEDFTKYPNTLESDIEKLESVGCDFLFNPTFEEVYGPAKAKDYDLGDLNNYMEGPFRPGHFQGVANVVIRLFEIVLPDVAFFGLKDYQQYLVVKHITKNHLPNITIQGIETVRDDNGLAMSSRNMRLTKSQYENALAVPKLMQEIGDKLSSYTIAEIKTWFEEKVNTTPELKYEYVEIADAENLHPVLDYTKHQRMRIFVAFYAGSVRLIDNIELVVE